MRRALAMRITWLLVVLFVACGTPQGQQSAGGGTATGGGDAATGGGDAAIGGGDAATGGGDAATGGGDAATGGGDAATGGGDAAIGGGDATTGGGDAATGGGDAATGGGDAATGGGDAATGGGDAATGGGGATTGGGDGTSDAGTEDGGADAGTEDAGVTCTGSLTACDGQCVDVQYSATNCGACGNVCSTSFATSSFCSNGACSCGSKTLCGSTCADLQTDNANCGGCGTVCTGGQAYCSQGDCRCYVSGQTFCGDTCASLSTNPLHCGACNSPCPTNGVCDGGTCSCPASTTLCGNACVVLATSLTDCGMCGNACAATETCSAGTCAPDREWVLWGLPTATTNRFTATAGTVSDVSTQLMWQRTQLPDAGALADAVSFCDGLDLETYTDWRVPTRAELYSIVDRSVTSPAIDSTYFPATPPQAFWATLGNGVLFDWGWTALSSVRNVRCVRAGVSTVTASRYLTSTDTVDDLVTGLRWQRNAASSMLWNQGATYCTNLTIDGGGWRVPKMEELMSLVDVRATGSVVLDQTAFPGTAADTYWSSEHVATSSAVWGIGFALAAKGAPVMGASNSGTARVRCVK